MDPTPLPARDRSSLFTNLLLIFLLLIALGLGGYYYHLLHPEFSISSVVQSLVSTAPEDNSLTLTAPTTAPTPLPEKKPPYILPTGAQTYRFSHGADVTGPKPQLVTIDPLDPQPGSTQTISVVIHSTSAVQSAVVIVGTDHQEKTLNLKLSSGDSLKGTYQGSWPVDDTYSQKYFLHYLLKSKTDTFDNTMYLR
jgi:hypothetical protein